MSGIDNKPSSELDNSIFEFTEKSFKALVQDGVDLISVLSADGRHIYISPSVERALGFSQEQYLGMSIYDFLHPDDIPRIQKISSLLVEATGTIQVSPFRVQNSKGEWRWFESRINNLLHDPDINGLVCSSRDITSKIESEEKLRKSVSRYESLVELTSDIIWECDLLSYTINFQRGLFEKLGYPTDKITDSPDWWKRKIHPDDRENLVLNICNALQSSKTNHLNLRHRFLSANGQYLEIQNRILITRDSQGKAKSLLGSMQDITQQQRHLKAIEKQNTLLKEISWDQAHEVRAPLSRILGLIDMIGQDDTDEQTMKQALNYLSSSAHELDQIIRGVVRKVEIMKKQLT